jgi:hypothetical protein
MLTGEVRAMEDLVDGIFTDELAEINADLQKGGLDTIKVTSREEFDIEADQ